MVDRISIWESFAKRNEIHPLLKRMMTGVRNGLHALTLCEEERGQAG